MHLAQKNRILFAEDNEFNQELVVDLLTEAGFSVVTANNGQEVLQLLQQHAPDFFHLILMDLEMPVMSGDQATLQIRQQPDYNDIPIVALTAHEEPGTKEACLAIGMQDYLMKPVAPEDLNKTMQLWLNQPQNKVPNKLSMATTEFYPQFQNIDTNMGLQSTANNPQLYLQLLRRFATSQRLSLKQIQAKHTTDIDPDFSRLIHTLKGISGTIGAKKVAQLCAEFEISLENACSHHDVDLAKMLTPLALALTDTLNELDAFLLIASPIQTIDSKRNNDKAAPPTLPVQITTITQTTLKALLQENDSVALDFFEENKLAFAQMFEKRRYIALQNAIENYDFELAGSLLNDNETTYINNEFISLTDVDLIRIKPT